MKKQDSDTESTDLLRAKITLETARIDWLDLQRFFAAGKAIAVDPVLDLVEVAAALAVDNKARFEDWLVRERVVPVTDEQAAQWHAENTRLWAVVVAPWVLVQEPTGKTNDG